MQKHVQLFEDFGMMGDMNSIQREFNEMVMKLPKKSNGELTPESCLEITKHFIQMEDMDIIKMVEKRLREEHDFNLSLGMAKDEEKNSYWKQHAKLLVDLGKKLNML